MRGTSCIRGFWGVLFWAFGQSPGWAVGADPGGDFEGVPACDCQNLRRPCCSFQLSIKENRVVVVPTVLPDVVSDETAEGGLEGGSLGTC